MLYNLTAKYAGAVVQVYCSYGNINKGMRQDTIKKFSNIHSYSQQESRFILLKFRHK